MKNRKENVFLQNMNLTILYEGLFFFEIFYDKNTNEKEGKKQNFLLGWWGEGVREGHFQIFFAPNGLEIKYKHPKMQLE